MGLTDFVRPAYHRRRNAELELSASKTKLRAAMIDRYVNLVKSRKNISEDSSSGSFLQAGNSPLIDDDSGPLFDLIAYGTDDAIDEASFREAQRRWYKLWVQDPLAHGWIELFVQHIVGDKFQMKSKDHDPRTQEVWDKQAESMAGPQDGPYAVPPYPFETFSQDVVRQALVLGDDFQHEFTNPYDGSQLYRSMNPVWIYNPGRMWPWRVREWTPITVASFGIQTDPEDIYRPVTYWNDPNRNGIMREVPASAVVHTKLGSRTMKRGRSLLLPVTKPLLQLNKILQARSDMHLLRTAVGFWDEIPEGADPELVKQLLTDNQIGTDSAGNAGVNTGRQYADEHGSRGFFSGLKRQFSTPNLEAGDAYNDILSHVYPMARALGLTLATCWGDTSQETQASARENGFGEILNFQSWQYFFGLNTFQRLGQRRIKSAIDTGQLSAMSFRKYDRIVGPPENNIRERGQEQCPRNTQFDCEFPELRVRDVKALTDALMAQLSASIIDKREFRIQLGYDSDEMAERVMLQKLDEPQDEAGQSATAELKAAMKSGNGNGNGRSDSKQIYRHAGTKS